VRLPRMSDKIYSVRDEKVTPKMTKIAAIFNSFSMSCTDF
jgi:hypothetical protein